MLPEFSITWTFLAPCPRVFTYWTQGDLFAAWMGPEGAHMKFIRFSPAGECMWRMNMPDGTHKYGKIQYLLQQDPKLLVYTQHFCTAEGHFCRAPFSATYPAILRAAVKFSPLGEACQIHFLWTIEGEYTEDEAETFLALKDAMSEGWTASFRKLENLLQTSHDDAV